MLVVGANYNKCFSYLIFLLDWIYGMLDGKAGHFPRELVEPVAGPEGARLFWVSCSYFIGVRLRGIFFPLFFNFSVFVLMTSNSGSIAQRYIIMSCS